MDILIFNMYKQQMLDFKNKPAFEICDILRYSFRLKMLKFSFRKNSSIILVPPASPSSTMERGGTPPQSDMLD
jgi:hypothetical protein